MSMPITLIRLSLVVGSLLLAQSGLAGPQEMGIMVDPAGVRKLDPVPVPPPAQVIENPAAFISGALPGAGAHPKLHHLSASACGTCHQEIYRQWKGSMHANSTALSDPIHGAMYRHVMGDPTAEGVRSKKGKYPVCLKCHAPSAALDGTTKLDAHPVYNEGINCVTCHAMERFLGSTGDNGKLRLGIDAYVRGDRLYGPSGRTLSPLGGLPRPGYQPQPATPPDVRGKQDAVAPEPTGEGLQGGFHPFPLAGNSALLRSADACLGCHHQRNNSHGVPLCATGSEFAASGSFNCQQCHMPVNNGYADHSMAGGHVRAMLERAVLLSLESTRDESGVAVDVVLQNTLPHRVPTAAPFRNMRLRLIGFDQRGAVVWRNYEQNVAKEDPKAFFHLTLLGPDGKPSPPPKATQLGPDSRLDPNERRVLSYSLPANVSIVRAELIYELLKEGQKKGLMKGVPAELKRPKVMAFAEERI